MSLSIKKILVLFCVTVLYAQSSLLDKLLPLMDWNTKEKEGALESLCHISGMLTEDQSLRTRYPQRENDFDIALDFIDFSTEIQKFFFISETQNQIARGWNNYSKEELEPYFTVLGFVSSQYPLREDKKDAYCVWGSSYPEIKARIDFAQFLLRSDSAPYLFLAGSLRPLSPNYDASKNTLRSIAQRQQLPKLNQVTEIVAMDDMVTYAPMRLKVTSETILIPIGQDDLEYSFFGISLKALEQIEKDYQDKVKNILFVASQPSIPFVQELLNLALTQSHLTFEVIGPLSPNPSLPDRVNMLQKTLWACGPRFLKVLELSSESQKVEDVQRGCQSLYQSYPFLYQSLPKICVLSES